ncbi:16S rRNA (adenine(1518)-N(6)/adenine(1519)-N(6))-dimethyltransferase RsmA [Megamonas funiformis]|jgi:16S rRNA (adenine1518-N6/adenine1519-N6)-dimethyltransferase|uniref:16S rRNA (adenine(1518)-N(6)/adenine(1519)-N(6))- dimethyltransferase RsmA n=1 Tax=Megamonas funiformis TaxID=437897 RepID=UPI0028A198C5|nr:16S rRNA (adenine(1518)-N(6)/adenine(1519)-N(6))-dimethyltransferase RsmA [Megamonas funiformis]
MKQPTIANKKVTRYILQRFGIHMSKRLGQNFLIDANIVQGIVDAANVQENDRVLEIGPGIGTLTQALAETGAEVTCVELDKRLPEVLAHTLDAYDNVRVIQGDILKVNIPEIMGDKPFKVVANLPYYITTPIIMALLEKHLPITDIVVMVQKEVAERMAAQPGGKTYGALSVAVQYYTVPEIALYVPPRSFMPPPEVDSVVVNCKVRQIPAVELIDEKMFFRVVKAAFGQRRKTLNNALKSMGVDKNIIADVLDKAGIEATRRGETLTMEEFGAIANILVQMAKQEA